MLMFINVVKAQVFLDNASSYDVNSIEGGAIWTGSGANFLYNNNGIESTKRALVYSTNSYQSEDGFRLTIEYITGSVGKIEGHNFSFGLISDETDLATYSGFNPFGEDKTIYSLGANLTTNGSSNSRGLIFTDGTNNEILDTSGTRVQFDKDNITKVYIEIGIGGSWQYRINDKYEASGVLLNGFDPSKSYHVAVYGQDDDGGGKSIQSIKLEKAPAPGDRAEGQRGTWTSGIDGGLVNARMKRLKTVDAFQVRFTDGAVLSAQHLSPHKLLESIQGGDAVVPTWGDLSLDNPVDDEIMDQVLNITGAGYKVKAYTNSENFVGENNPEYVEFVENWMEYCDTNPEVQAFINSQPYHTGIWNRTTQEYVDASVQFPYRKYMFCYAEYVLKDYALRYGEFISSWIFDDAATMEQMGDNPTSGIIEEQRIYQAYSDAVHAGNINTSTAFNNGRSGENYNAYPFAPPKRFEDFTFGHAFGGNKNHAQPGRLFDENYKHVTRMAATDGSVFEGGPWDWDNRIVGNFHSKLATQSWKHGGTQGWIAADFYQWNLEAMQAGGSMTWDGAYNRGLTTIYDWVYELLEGLDEYLMKYELPGQPNWARAYTILPKAYLNQPYSHVLVEGEDFWDPEGDEITSLLALDNFPSWLTINESQTESGKWILSGIPTETLPVDYEFRLQVSDASGATERTVELNVLDSNIIMINGVDISTTSASMLLGDTLSLSAEVNPSNATNQNVTWASNNSAVATVDSNGLVTAHSIGNAIISVVTAEAGFMAKSAITVVDAINYNLALNGTAIQSSTDYNGEPSRAIDGNTDGNYSNDSVTHTHDEANPWWQVDLGAEYSIGNINIFNRAGANYTRLSNFTLIIYDNNDTEVYSETVTTAPNPSLTLNAGGATGQIVKIQSNITNPLSLAEVEVFGTTLSITNINEGFFKLYPNPTRDIFTIKTPNGFKGSYFLYDYVGKSIFNNKINKSSTIIDISNLKSGIYFIRIDGDKTTVTKKIIKQ